MYLFYTSSVSYSLATNMPLVSAPISMIPDWCALYRHFTCTRTSSSTHLVVDNLCTRISSIWTGYSSDKRYSHSWIIFLNENGKCFLVSHKFHAKINNNNRWNLAYILCNSSCYIQSIPRNLIHLFDAIRLKNTLRVHIRFENTII